MDKIAVSIIVPIYNAEKFLHKGLDSCVNQTLQNIEVICVNDMSTDGSCKVIKEYAEKYPEKIVQIDLKTKGMHGGAINQGILRARGEYLCFMDSDDYLNLHLCEDVYTEAKAHDADMVIYDYIRVDGEEQYPVEVIGREEIDLWYSHDGWALWMQMVKRDIILNNALFFPENTRAIDAAMIPIWRCYAKKLYKIDKAYYYYVNRTDSLVHDIKPSSVMALIVGVIPYRYRMMEQKGLLEQFKSESDWMISRDIFLTLQRLLKLKWDLTVEDIVALRKKLDFLNGHIFDETFTKYFLTYTERDMVKTFFYHPEDFCKKYCDYSVFMKMQIQYGLDRSVEGVIEEIVTSLCRIHGSNIAVWGVGKKGIPIISTLIRMGYEFTIFDNKKYGEEVWEGAHQYICSFEDLGKKRIDIVLITTDFGYKVIADQIQESYPQIKIVNLLREIRRLVDSRKRERNVEEKG